MGSAFLWTLGGQVYNGYCLVMQYCNGHWVVGQHCNGQAGKHPSPTRIEPSISGTSASAYLHTFCYLLLPFVSSDRSSLRDDALLLVRRRDKLFIFWVCLTIYKDGLTWQAATPWFISWACWSGALSNLTLSHFKVLWGTNWNFEVLLGTLRHFFEDFSQVDFSRPSIRAFVHRSSLRLKSVFF